MGNGERETRSGKQKVGSKEWGVSRGKQEAESEKLKAENRKREAGSRRQEAGSE